jgi:hypothetical protein
MKKLLMDFVYLCILAVFGYVIIGGPIAVSYYLLGYLGVPQNLVNVGTVISSIFSISFFTAFTIKVYKYSSKK